MFEYIIVGAGIAGIVLAERISNVLDKKVLIIEMRNHIGGNCYDYYNGNGILVHKYGPHIFHTDIKEVWDYLSQFTQWNGYQHRVLGFIDGKNVPIPFNLDSLDQLQPPDRVYRLGNKLIEKFGYGVKVPILELKKINDPELKFLADFIYQKVFRNYTKKQWGLKPEELDHSVTDRVPVLISHDNRYFQDRYQGLPKKGYTYMFQHMLSNENMEIRLGTDFKEIIDFEHDKNRIKVFDEEFKGKLIYTGKIDEFFNYEFGELPYRSLNFEFENLNQEYYQEVGTVNYPNDYDFTRITEFKHLTMQKSDSTTIAREYPQKYLKNVNIPYYPIPQRENREIYERYRSKAEQFDHLIFIGRLAEYRYYDMDEVVAAALNVFKEKIE